MKISNFLIALLMSCFAVISFAEPPAVGTPAPDFSLPDQAGKTHTLSDYSGNWLLLYFYPKDDTPGCTTEACALRDHITVLHAMGAKVVGVSLDDVASHAEFAKKHELPFTLLADTEAVVTKRYDALRDMLVMQFAKRYSFLISPDGKIAKRYLDVDPDAHAGEVIADLKQLIADKEKS